MRFMTIGSTFFKQGSAKAYAVHDERWTYYIPKSQVTIVETIPPANEFDDETYIIEIPDWIIKKNRIPVFKLCELALDR